MRDDDAVSMVAADGRTLSLEFVDLRHFGLVARHPAEDALFIVDDAGAHPLWCGPSVLRLLEVLPDDGELPVETAAAVMVLVRSARAPMSLRRPSSGA